jgi:hypothetical protein
VVGNADCGKVVMSNISIDIHLTGALNDVATVTQLSGNQIALTVREITFYGTLEQVYECIDDALYQLDKFGGTKRLTGSY